MPEMFLFFSFFFFVLDWILECFFSKSLPHFTTVDFANHFVYVC